MKVSSEIVRVPMDTVVRKGPPRGGEDPAIPRSGGALETPRAQQVRRP